MLADLERRRTCTACKNRSSYITHTMSQQQRRCSSASCMSRSNLVNAGRLVGHMLPSASCNSAPVTSANNEANCSRMALKRTSKYCAERIIKAATYHAYEPARTKVDRSQNEYIPSFSRCRLASFQALRIPPRISTRWVNTFLRSAVMSDNAQ